MKWLFGLKKKKAPEKDDVRKVGSRMLRISSLDMFGPYSESRNGSYLLLRQDSDREHGRGGYRESGNGKFALVSNGRVVFTGECERPTEGAVSNSGTLAITDTLFGDKLGSKLYVYSVDGKLIFEYRFSANTLNIGISPEGTHVVAQMCNSDTDHSGKLFLFEIRQAKVIAEFIPDTGWANEYEFSVPDGILSLCYRGNRKYKYKFDGSFLDKERFERERVEDASPTDLVLIVREKFKSATNEQLPDLLSLIDRAFAGNLSEYQDYRALAFRLKGEINESLGNNELAISAYREAISIDPKIGVKQRLKKLEKVNAPSGTPRTKKKNTKQTTGIAMNSQITGESVQEVIYNFTQYAFIGGSIKEAHLDSGMFASTFEILRAGPLSQQELAIQPLPIQRVIYELLTQYIMFFTMNPSLPFPPDFLAQSNSKLLGEQVTAYMAQHEWPFPQMIQQ